METAVKLNINVTDTCRAEFEAVVTPLADGDFEASIEALGLKAIGGGVQDALQELVWLIKDRKPQQLAKGIKVGR